MNVSPRTHSGSVGAVSLGLIGSEGVSDPRILHCGFTPGETLIFNNFDHFDVGDLWALNMTNTVSYDGMRFETLELTYKGTTYTFGRNEMIYTLSRQFNRIPFFFFFLFFFFF